MSLRDRDQLRDWAIEAAQVGRPLDEVLEERAAALREMGVSVEDARLLMEDYYQWWRPDRGTPPTR